MYRADRPHLQHRTLRRHAVSVLAQPTGDLGGLVVDEASANRSVMMPTRKQTREQDRRDRIAQERRERRELIAEEERERQELSPSCRGVRWWPAQGAAESGSAPLTPSA